ncbi:MAG: hypothetical protein ABIE47_09755 [Pseudomonadota bacterium]
MPIIDGYAESADSTTKAPALPVSLWYEPGTFIVIRRLTKILMPSTGAPMGIERAEL